MNIASFTEQIGNLIAKDELPKAIEKLRMLLKSTPKLDEAIIQSARYNDLSQQIRMGGVDFETANISKNKIRYAILELLRDIEELPEANFEIKTEIENLPDEIADIPGKQIITGNKNNVIQNISNSSITINK